MKRLVLLVFLFSVYSNMYGQYNWTSGKIILKTGDTLKGYVKIPMASGDLISISSPKVKFRKDRKGKKRSYDHTQVDKVFFKGRSSANLGYYEYITLPNNKSFLFKLVKNGKVKLYLRTIKRSVSNGQVYINDDYYASKKAIKIKQYYVIKNDEETATKIIRPDDMDNPKDDALTDFKTNVLEYFSDCPSVVSYINDNLYNDYDIVQIVDDYNILCDD